MKRPGYETVRYETSGSHFSVSKTRWRSITQSETWDSAPYLFCHSNEILSLWTLTPWSFVVWSITGSVINNHYFDCIGSNNVTKGTSSWWKKHKEVTNTDERTLFDHPHRPAKSLYCKPQSKRVKTYICLPHPSAKDFRDHFHKIHQTNTRCKTTAVRGATNTDLRVASPTLYRRWRCVFRSEVMWRHIP